MDGSIPALGQSSSSNLCGIIVYDGGRPSLVVVVGRRARAPREDQTKSGPSPVKVEYNAAAKTGIDFRASFDL